MSEPPSKTKMSLVPPTLHELPVEELMELVESQGPDALKNACIQYLEKLQLGSESGQAKSLTLLDLPYELVVLMASWLDMHDVEYRLKAVCKLLYTVANDPITWARMVVAACTDAELRRVLKKHPSVTLVRFPTSDGPNLITGDVRVDKSQWLPTFTHVVCTSERLQDEACLNLAPQLRSLDVYWEDSAFITDLQPNNMSLPPVLSPFTRLTHLGVYNAFELRLDVCCPLLTSLECRDTGMTVEAWTAFVESHPNLRSLNFTLEEDLNEDMLRAPLPRELRRLILNGYDDDMCEKFLLRLIAASDHVQVFSSELFASTQLIEALSSKPNLTEIVRLYLDDHQITADDFLGFKRLRVRHLRLSEIMGDIEFIMLEKTSVTANGNLEHPFIREQLHNLTGLRITFLTVTFDMAFTLGQQLKRLRHFSMAEVLFAKDAASALAPALVGVQRFACNNCTEMSDFPYWLAQSKKLNEVDVHFNNAHDTHMFMSQLLQNCEQQCFVEMQIAPCSIPTLHELTNYLRARRCTVQHINISIQSTLTHEERYVLVPDFRTFLRHHCACDPQRFLMTIKRKHADNMW